MTDITQPAKPEPEPQITGCTEQGFMIDSASANELVAYDYAVSTLCSAVLRILDGEHNGFGGQNEPWATVRNRLLELTQPTKPEGKSFAKLYEKHAVGIAEQAAILEKELKGKP